MQIQRDTLRKLMEAYITDESLLKSKRAAREGASRE